MIIGFFQFKYADKMNVIRLKQNLGGNYARNIAIQQARGKYIALLDSDDYNSKDRIEKQVAFLENNTHIEILGGRSVQLFEGDKAWKNHAYVLPYYHDLIKYTTLF